MKFNIKHILGVTLYIGVYLGLFRLLPPIPEGRFWELLVTSLLAYLFFTWIIMFCVIGATSEIGLEKKRKIEAEKREKKNKEIERRLKKCQEPRI